MIKKLVIALIGFILILAVINWYGIVTPTKDIDDQTLNPSSKPVVFLLIDSLMDEPLQKAIEEGKAPALEYLSANGNYFPEIVSSYPTMSVAIDSTLLTGTYPDQHRIPALAWFNKEDNRLINYGSSVTEAYNLGFKNILHDTVYNLNQEHLSENVNTIYEKLDKRQLDSASLNGLMYRGNQSHSLEIPRILPAFNLLSGEVSVDGPSLLSVGSLSQFNPENNRHNNFWQKLGINDAFTANELKYLIQNDILPSFTLAYFSDLDQRVHEEGRMDIEGIEEIDEHLQDLLNEYPTWEEALEEVTFIVYGDSGHSNIEKEESKALIDLNSLSDTYELSSLGDPIRHEDQVVLAVNARMAYINLLDDEIDYTEMASHLIEDDRIGFIAWEDDTGNHVISGDSDEQLTFNPQGQYVDEYNQEWDLSGDFSILDLSVKGENRIEYGVYPDGLARLYGALHSHDGRYLIVDAKPGHEFIGDYSPTHLGGGGHGSLHEQDSLTPLITTGTIIEPEHKRIVNFKEWILELTSY